MINGMQQLTEKYKKLNKGPVWSDTMKFIPNSDPFPQFGTFLANSLLASEVIDLPKFIIVGKKIEATIITKDSIPMM